MQLLGLWVLGIALTTIAWWNKFYLNDYFCLHVGAIIIAVGLVITLAAFRTAQWIQPIKSRDQVSTKHLATNIYHFFALGIFIVGNVHAHILLQGTAQNIAYPM